MCRDMSELCNRFSAASVAGACLLLALAMPVASAASLDGPADRIAGICLARNYDDHACQCLAREAGSRFEPGQLHRIAEALEAGETAADIGEHLRQSGASEAEAASFRHRLNTAQVVIQQTCGASIFEIETD